MTRRFLILAAVCAAAVFAADRPDFSGEWKANIEKSNFGPMPAPTSVTRKIVQKGDSLTIDSVQSRDSGEIANEMKLTTDGKENTNTLKTQNGEVPIKTTANWQGSNLLSKSKFDIQGMEITTSEKWTMAEDGKSFTIAQTISTPQGDFELSYLFEKAAGTPAAPAK